MTLIFDATNAYLGPLLEKHTAGKPLVWEDLVASQTACKAVLRQSNNTFVSSLRRKAFQCKKMLERMTSFGYSRMDKLHQSQVKAYHEAATKSVKEWALALPLQPMEEGDTKIAFVNRCIASISSAVNTMPNWKLGNAKVTAVNEIRKRAIKTFEKYHPVEDDAEDEKAPALAASASGEARTADEADEGSESGVITEDGELTGEEDDDENGSDQEQTNNKNKQQNRKKGKRILKKGTKAKAGFRNNRGGRGSRRGGRGGGRGVQK